MRRSTDVSNARGAPRPLIRRALLRPFSLVHSRWSINPGGIGFSEKSTMLYEPITIAYEPCSNSATIRVRTSSLM
jgi:hypothetical protein